MDKKKLFGLTLTQLQSVAQEMQMPKFVAKQIADWLYKKHVLSIDEMTNISKDKRALLASSYEVGRYAPFSELVSNDGTKKYLFGIPMLVGETRPLEITMDEMTKKYVETVYIPEADRATLCVSCQVGCKMNCSFCMTGKQGFSAHLTAGDILNQMQSIPDADRLTNIVFMGMGEPMDNLDAVLAALEILTSDYGYAWSPKRITVSTVGLLPGLKRFLAESKCHLAVSLHNPFHEERIQQMPVEKAYSLADVISEIKKYDFTGQRRVSFEYTVFKSWNDTERHAKELAHLLDGLECRINLIRFHSIPGAEMQGVTDKEMEHFRDMLNRYGITATIRRSRGEDIFAACGLLSSQRNK